jgi:outer membrane biosynthesis protein TonB
MAQTAQFKEYSYFNASMRGPFFMSGAFHAIIFLVSIFGLPLVMTPPKSVDIPITVEIVDIAELTQTNKIAKPIEKIEEEEKPAPKISKPSPPEIEEIPPVKMDEPPKDVEKPVSELAPPDKAKPAEKAVKPAPKKPVKPIEKKKEEPKRDFNSLLKNLAPDAQEQIKPEETLDKVLAAATEKTQEGSLSDRLTMSEIDAIQRAVNEKLRPCWYVQTGAKNAEDLAVEVRIKVNPDMTVQQATILNQLLYTTDSYYRAAADAAKRALLDPRCAPLPLPPGKYEQWKDIRLNFNPGDML